MLGKSLRLLGGATIETWDLARYLASRRACDSAARKTASSIYRVTIEVPESEWPAYACSGYTGSITHIKALSPAPAAEDLLTRKELEIVNRPYKGVLAEGLRRKRYGHVMHRFDRVLRGDVEFQLSGCEYAVKSENVELAVQNPYTEDCFVRVEPFDEKSQVARSLGQRILWDASVDGPPDEFLQGNVLAAVAEIFVGLKVQLNTLAVRYLAPELEEEFARA